VLHGVKEDDLEDYLLAHHPAMRASIEQADRQYRRKGGIALSQVICGLEAKFEGSRGRGRLRR
jgi:hypothetical protein